MTIASTWTAAQKIDNAAFRFVAFDDLWELNEGTFDALANQFHAQKHVAKADLFAALDEKLAAEGTDPKSVNINALFHAAVKHARFAK